nr:hypothetical protein [Mycoplasmopsis bovis]
MQVKHSELTEALKHIEIKDLKGDNKSLKNIIPSQLKVQHFIFSAKW